MIFGKFKKRNPRAVGFFHRILDRNVVVIVPVFSQIYHKIFIELGGYINVTGYQREVLSCGVRGYGHSNMGNGWRGSNTLSKSYFRG